MPPIEGWTITEELPDIDDAGRAFIDYADIGEHPFPVWEALEQPAKDIAEYRYRLNRARRRAVRGRLEELLAYVDTSLPALLADVLPSSAEVPAGALVEQLRGAFREIERLMGEATRRSSRWGDLARHLSFGQGHDWHDIANLDWPDVRTDVEDAGRGDDDPLPVPSIDLGVVASGNLTGGASSALPWHRLDPSTFERLLYDLLRDLPQHQNVQWLQRTQAADRGRDLTCER